jgi:hypothetical protein
MIVRAVVVPARPTATTNPKRMSAAHKRMWVVTARDWPPKQTALFFGGLMTSRLLPAVSRAASLFPHRGAANVSVPSGNLYVSGYAVPNGG